MGRIAYICIMACLCLSVNAQIKIVPREKLEAMSSPRLSDNAAFLHFETTYIKADPMDEDDGIRTFVYPFENKGRDTLKVTRFVSTCSCASASIQNQEVLPGQKSEVTVRYNPKGHPGRFERRIFVYTGTDTAPSAILRLAVDVERGTDLSGFYPVAMGNIRLRREEVFVTEGVRTIERCTFINVSGRPLKLECDKALLPPCLSFAAEPETVAAGKEGEIVITYDPSKGGARESMPVVLKGMGVPPSQSKINVILKK